MLQTYFLLLAQGFSWRAFRRVGDEEDRRVQEICLHMKKKQHSFLCDVLVLQPFDVNIGG